MSYILSHNDGAPAKGIVGNCGIMRGAAPPGEERGRKGGGGGSTARLRFPEHSQPPRLSHGVDRRMATRASICPFKPLGEVGWGRGPQGKPFGREGEIPLDKSKHPW